MMESNLIKKNEMKASPDKYRLQAYHHLKSQLHLNDEQTINILDTLATPLKTTLQSVEEAHTKHDLNAISEAAHSLKGALLNLGLDELAEIAKIIEKSSSMGEKISHKKQLTYIKEALQQLINKDNV